MEYQNLTFVNSVQRNLYSINGARFELSLVESEKGVENNYFFFVKKFSYGKVVIYSEIENIEEFANLLEGCFNNESNFEWKLRKTFGRSNYNWEEVEFEICNVTANVSRGASVEEICMAWRNVLDSNK